MIKDEEEKNVSEEEKYSASKVTSDQPATAQLKMDTLKREDLLAIVKKQYISLSNARKQIDVFKNQIAEKDQNIKELLSATSSMTESDAKQFDLASNILRMELNDYKQSLETVRNSLNSSQAELKEKNLVLKELTEKYQSLLEERETLSASIKDLTSEKIEFRGTLDEKSKLLCEKSKEIDSFTTEIFNVKHQLSCEIEELKKELSEKTHQLIESKQLEQRTAADYRHSKVNVQNLERKLQDLQEEYDQFKSRAQYVINQHSTQETSSNQNKSSEIKGLIEAINLKNEELSYVKNRCMVLEEELQISKQNIVNAEEQLHALQKEREAEVSQEKINCRKLAADFERRIKADKITIESLKNEIAMMSKNHLAQLDKLNKEWEKRLEELDYEKNSLQSELTKLKSEFYNNTVGASSTALSPEMLKPKQPYNELSTKIQNKSQHHDHEIFYDNSFNENEDLVNSDSEGEDISSVLQSVLNHPPDEDIIDNRYLINPLGHWKWESSEQETPEQLIERLEGRLVDVENQLVHTRDLLAETEETNVKLGEQVELLKEEIRRVERNQERQAHVANNSEYLKNVLLKYLAPERVGDERLQMLPVLKTMLKLTADEVANIELNIRGEFPTTDEPGSTPNKDWNSYFNLKSLF